MEKWFLTNPSVVQFDEKFQFFECAMEELLELPPIDSHLCLLIHLKPLIQSIKQHIEGWTEAYARALFDSSAVALDELMNKLKVDSQFLGWICVICYLFSLPFCYPCFNYRLVTFSRCILPELLPSCSIRCIVHSKHKVA